MLIVAGGKDRIVPASIVHRTHKKYARSSAVTDFRAFPEMTHWIIAQPGWQEVAEQAAEWVDARARGGD